MIRVLPKHWVSYGKKMMFKPRNGVNHKGVSLNYGVITKKWGMTMNMYPKNKVITMIFKPKGEVKEP